VKEAVPVGSLSGQSVSSSSTSLSRLEPLLPCSSPRPPPPHDERFTALRPIPPTRKSLKWYHRLQRYRRLCDNCRPKQSLHHRHYYCL